MPFNIEKKDLRSQKSLNALNMAFYKLLSKKNFRTITVKDLCNEALISRATFYAHYNDKYALLKSWLANLMLVEKYDDKIYESMDAAINQFVNENNSIIKNVIENAEQETLDIVFDFILTFLDLTVEKYDEGKINPKYIVLSNIFAGGMVYYLLWHIKNKFPFEVMNVYLYDIIQKFREL